MKLGRYRRRIIKCSNVGPEHADIGPVLSDRASTFGTKQSSTAWGRMISTRFSIGPNDVLVCETNGTDKHCAGMPPALIAVAMTCADRFTCGPVANSAAQTSAYPFHGSLPFIVIGRSLAAFVLLGYVDSWHIADLQRLPGSGPFIAAFQTWRRGVAKVGT